MLGCVLVHGKALVLCGIPPKLKTAEGLRQGQGSYECFSIPLCSVTTSMYKLRRCHFTSCRSSQRTGLLIFPTRPVHVCAWMPMPSQAEADRAADVSTSLIQIFWISARGVQHRYPSEAACRSVSPCLLREKQFLFAVCGTVLCAKVCAHKLSLRLHSRPLSLYS